MTTRAWILLCGIAVLFPVFARADTTIEARLNGEPQTTYVSAHKLRAEMGGEGMMIFRGDEKVLYAIDTRKKTYTALTEADVKKMGEKMSDVQAQMQEALKSMPAEQRAAVEKMMQDRMKPAEAPRKVVTPMGEKKTINGFDCSGYRVATGEDGGRQMEVWATDPKNLKLTEEDLGVFQEMAEFMKALGPMGQEMEGWMKDFDKPAPDQVPGVPILTIQRDDGGKETLRVEVVRITRGGIDASVFDLPAGLSEEKGMMGK